MKHVAWVYCGILRIDRAWSIHWRSWGFPMPGATLRLRDLRGQRAGQHKLVEEVVQLLYVWVVESPAV